MFKKKKQLQAEIQYLHANHAREIEALELQRNAFQAHVGRLQQKIKGLENKISVQQKAIQLVREILLDAYNHPIKAEDTHGSAN